MRASQSEGERAVYKLAREGLTLEDRRSAQAFVFSLFGDEVSVNVTGAVGEWTHWAAVYARSTGLRVLYRNGVPVAETSSGAWLEVPTATVCVGFHTPSATFYFGDVDELVVWRRALNATEVAVVNASGSGLSAALQSGLAMYHHFDVVEYVGNEVEFQDASTNNIDLRVFGGFKGAVQSPVI